LQNLEILMIQVLGIQVFRWRWWEFAYILSCKKHPTMF
jgi:hypothetical protein